MESADSLVDVIRKQKGQRFRTDLWPAADGYYSMAPAKSTSKSGSQTQAQQQQRLKVIVRRLPADLPEAVFWQSVAPWVTRDTTPQQQVAQSAETVVWSLYKPGKVRKHNQDKDDVASRAYITFKTPDALVAFHRSYDGWTFRDKTGRTSQALVEFAPYQRAPINAVKQDPRQGTIEQDSDFLAFKEALDAPNAADQVQTEAVIPLDPKSTPLLEHLRAQRAADKAAKKAKKKAIKQDTLGDDKKAGKKVRAGKVDKRGNKELTSTTSAASAADGQSKPPRGKSRGAKKLVQESTKSSLSATSSSTSLGVQDAGNGQQKRQQGDVVRKVAQPRVLKPQVAEPPKILLRNPDRPPASTTSSASKPSGSAPQPTAAPAVAQKPAKDVAAQRRQLGAALGAALNESNSRGRGRGRGSTSSGRGQGGSDMPTDGSQPQTQALTVGAEPSRGRGGARGRGGGRGRGRGGSAPLNPA
ncbi:hypothetical protein OIV83_001470 [Microbotryomycetes sp. JL201]|nr:hypothetical protein OIV83_001470 [Microbotryomycetes sp. JL201]